MENVLSAHPLPSGQVLILAKKAGALDEAAAKKALEGTKFKFASFKKS